MQLQCVAKQGAELCNHNIVKRGVNIGSVRLKRSCIGVLTIGDNAREESHGALVKFQRYDGGDDLPVVVYESDR